jgi:sulfatase maturation enzyme AslB (radical SAM superfamily)
MDPICAKCDVRFFCGGGCRAQASNAGVKPLNTHNAKCEEYKHIIYDLMWMLSDYPQLSTFKTKVGETLRKSISI